MPSGDGASGDAASGDEATVAAHARSNGDGAAHRAAVVGSPVAHSKSPDLHRAGYRELGMTDWSYDRIDCAEDGFAEMVDRLPADVVGLSVTMPNKKAALAYATEVTDRARAVGAANTLVRTDTGWRADCTDVDGVTGSLRELGYDSDLRELTGSTAVLVGAGGTALAVVQALAEAGVASIAVVARDADRAAGVLELARAHDIDTLLVEFAPSTQLRALCGRAAVTVNTVPVAGVAPLVDDLAVSGRVLDVIYDPWPTPLAEAVEAQGGLVVGGLVMLLNQAFGQFEQFTGRAAPREAMADAIGL
ncbi:shikimate dehydrogenase [Gordonia jinhuaensis]|nr:shikimate dehydrogenase [Gordonia jinhuaensis]